MKKILLLFILIQYLPGYGQQHYLSVEGINKHQTQIIDSLGFQKTTQENLVDTAVKRLLEKLNRKGYLESELISKTKKNDSCHVYIVDLKNRTKYLHLYINTKIKAIFDIKTDTVKIPFEESENYLNQLTQIIETKGFSVSKISLQNITKKKSILAADLAVDLDQKRTLNDIVINGYEKFPKGFKKNIIKRYKNRTFNQITLEKINKEFNSLRFVKQLKYPEILFTTDSTKVYVFLEKKKNNSFDGFLGFGNADGKFTLNGNIDVSLNNTLNTGDSFSVKWRNDGKEQTNFNLSTEFPFAFGSPIGIKVQLNIFKQDSIFQNSKTSIDFSYRLSNASKIYLGYQSTESSDIQNQNTSLLNDYNSRFYTTGIAILTYQDDELFPEKTNLNFAIGTGKRSSKFNTDDQILAQLNMDYSLKLNTKSSLFLSSQNYFLQSNTYLTNELYRFGGIKSIRGFRENTLQSNQTHLVLTEYRFKFSNNFYMHSIVDYGYFYDKTTKTSSRPLGLGLGFGLATKSGLFKLIYANGTDNESIIKLSNSIVHLSLKSYF